MTASTENGHGTPPSDPDLLRAEIARTRDELGHTVEALAAKADVKARVQEAKEDAKVKAKEAVQTAKLRVREGAEQVAVNAAYAGRELRAHPAQTLQTTLQRMVTSVRERPTPWLVAAGLLVLAGVIAAGKGRDS